MRAPSEDAGRLGAGNGLASTGRWRQRPSRLPEQQTAPPTQRISKPNPEHCSTPPTPDSAPPPPTISRRPALSCSRPASPSGYSIPTSKPLICIPDLCSDFRCRRPASGPKLTAWAHHQVYLSVEEGGPAQRGGPPSSKAQAQSGMGVGGRGGGLLPSRINRHRSTPRDQQLGQRSTRALNRIAPRSKCHLYSGSACASIMAPGGEVTSPRGVRTLMRANRGSHADVNGATRFSSDAVRIDWPLRTTAPEALERLASGAVDSCTRLWEGSTAPTPAEAVRRVLHRGRVAADSAG
jgi:hypothetical protein